MCIWYVSLICMVKKAIVNLNPNYVQLTYGQSVKNLQLKTVFLLYERYLKVVTFTNEMERILRRALPPIIFTLVPM